MTDTPTNQPWTDEDLRRAVDEIENEHAAVEAAINRGIDEGADGAPLSALDRAAIEMLIAVDVADPGELELEGVTGHEFAARCLAASPLMRKVALAVFLEYAANERGLPDGILGRALDQAIDQLTPYAKTSPHLGPEGRELFEGRSA